MLSMEVVRNVLSIMPLSWLDNVIFQVLGGSEEKG